MRLRVLNGLHEARVRDFLVPNSYDPIGTSPDEFGAFIQAELKRYGEIAHVAKIRVE